MYDTNFRLYHPGWVQSHFGGAETTRADLTPEESAKPGISFFIDRLPDEDHLTMSDWLGQGWSW